MTPKLMDFAQEIPPANISNARNFRNALQRDLFEAERFSQGKIKVSQLRALILQQLRYVRQMSNAYEKTKNQELFSLCREAISDYVLALDSIRVLKALITAKGESMQTNMLKVNERYRLYSILSIQEKLIEAINSIAEDYLMRGKFDVRPKEAFSMIFPKLDSWIQAEEEILIPSRTARDSAGTQSI